MHRLGPSAALAVALLAAGPATAWAAAAGALALPREATLTARLVAPTVAWAAPRATARPRMVLAGVTEWSRAPQRLMVTGRRRDRDGRRWVRVQLPVRPNGSNGWVREEAVRLSGTRLRVVVRRGARRLEVWSGARRIASWRAGVGRTGTPTPLGDFAVQDPVRTAPDWRGVYGRWTLTLTAHSRVVRRFMGGEGLVAIHGTGAGRAWRVGRASSYGCVILTERRLAALARIVRPGTPVSIRP